MARFDDSGGVCGPRLCFRSRLDRFFREGELLNEKISNTKKSFSKTKKMFIRESSNRKTTWIELFFHEISKKKENVSVFPTKANSSKKFIDDKKSRPNNRPVFVPASTTTSTSSISSMRCN